MNVSNRKQWLGIATFIFIILFGLFIDSDFLKNQKSRSIKLIGENSLIKTQADINLDNFDEETPPTYKPENNEEIKRFNYLRIQNKDIRQIQINYYSLQRHTTIIEDEKMISDIIEMLESSREINDRSEIEEWHIKLGLNNIILIDKSGYMTTIPLYFDFLDRGGYIHANQTYYIPDTTFLQYVAKIHEFKNTETSATDDVIRLFSNYGWTIDYKVYDEKHLLPENLLHSAGEYPYKIYWAYNNELSSEIGLDFSNYLGKEVEVKIYTLREHLPELFWPRQNARGIVLLYEGKIISAFIDSGRHDGFACSLNRKTIEEITGKKWESWSSEYINYEDEIENYLLRKTPEEILEIYFEALDNGDYEMVLACLTRKKQSEHLFRNMDNNTLYNAYEDLDFNIDSVELLELNRITINDPIKVVTYIATFNADYTVFQAAQDGINGLFITLRRENDNLGWKISNMGTGP